jgi:hypothetical protein
MGHESPIELWSPNLTTFCFAGFGTDRLRCQETMKTAGRENPNRWATVPRNRAHGAVGQNNSRSIVWAEKQEKFQPKEKCFFLTSTFIELIRSWDDSLLSAVVRAWGPFLKAQTFWRPSDNHIRLAISNVPTLVVCGVGDEGFDPVASGKSHVNISGKPINGDVLDISAKNLLKRQTQGRVHIGFVCLCLPGPNQYAV